MYSMVLTFSHPWTFESFEIIWQILFTNQKINFEINFQLLIIENLKHFFVKFFVNFLNTNFILKEVKNWKFMKKYCLKTFFQLLNMIFFERKFLIQERKKTFYNE